jgi:hypothetical protein
MVFGIFGLEFLLCIRLGAKNRVLVYSLFGSFLEDLDIDEFNKILGHCASGNDKRFLLLVI